MKCAASLSTSSSGVAVRCLLFRQRCACCGHTAKENRLSQSKFRCQVCGYTANADVN
ncbi:zinc ribbon domain-containing protein, partial [Shigella dysenteriae]|uniref:zinc ribbon domain-containing protein n=1 Tax=Shigella dysenteriae TaxID=622 RepID=UPI003F61834B